VTALQRTVIPKPVGMNGNMPFINPPPAAVAFAPIAALPLAAGRVLWAVAVAMLPFTGLAPYLTYVTYLAAVVTSHFSGAGEAGSAVWRGDLASTEGLNGLLVGWLGQDAVGVVNALWAAAVVAVLALYGLAARRVRPASAQATPGRCSPPVLSWCCS
jgi:hypothetical protein